MLYKNYFSPKSVAVIGASPEPAKLGYSVITNIINYGYQGKVYPVNPNYKEIMQLTSYAKVSDIPAEVEMVVIVIPAQYVPQVLEESGQKGVKAAVIISAGFKETGVDGQKLEREILDIGSKHKMRILGPNCLGFIDTSTSLNASFAAGMAEPGNIAFISQSGAICGAILDWSKNNGIGFSKFVSLGNKADINETDLIEAWKDDPKTSVVIAYLEGISDGTRFRKAAAELTRVKPLILIKAGGTSAGSKAASSHTGTLAGFDAAYDAVFRQSGVLRVTTLEELFDFAFAFTSQPVIKDNRITIITNAGGPGIISADASENAGLKLSSLSETTVDGLRKCLPATANFYNPVDVLGDAGPDRYREALDIILKDPKVDGTLVLLTPQSVTDVDQTADVVIKTTEKSDKPVLTSFMGGPTVAKGLNKLITHGIPCYPFPERAIASFKAMYRYRKWLERKEENFVHYDVDIATAKKILKQAITNDRHTLSDLEARQIIAAYGLPVPKSLLATTTEEAITYAAKIGYPVVMKIASPDILHKTDIGGVRVNLRNAAAVRRAFLEITDSAHHLLPDAHIQGVDIQPLAKGKEIILGMNRDAQFGPLLMFGLGGIYVEVLKDVSFRVAPITRQDALDMIHEIHGYRLLSGVRGEEAADIDAIIECLLRLSQMAMDFPEISEMDINPLMVAPQNKGAIALDCRMGLSYKEKE